MRLCEKPSRGRVTCGKPNPLNPPYQGGLSLNSPLTRGQGGVGMTNIEFFAQSLSQERQMLGFYTVSISHVA